MNILSTLKITFNRDRAKEMKGRKNEKEQEKRFEQCRNMIFFLFISSAKAERVRHIEIWVERLDINHGFPWLNEEDAKYHEC